VAVQLQIEPQLNYLLSSLMDLNAPREAIKLEQPGFVEVYKVKWSELLLKNYNCVVETLLEYDRLKVTKVFSFYEAENLLKFILSMVNPANAGIMPRLTCLRTSLSSVKYCVVKDRW